MKFFRESSWPSDGVSGKWTIAITRSSVPDREEGPPLDGDPPSNEDPLMKIFTIVRSR